MKGLVVGAAGREVTAFVHDTDGHTAPAGGRVVDPESGGKARQRYGRS